MNGTELDQSNIPGSMTIRPNETIVLPRPRTLELSEMDGSSDLSKLKGCFESRSPPDGDGESYPPRLLEDDTDTQGRIESLEGQTRSGTSIFVTFFNSVFYLT